MTTAIPQTPITSKALETLLLKLNRRTIITWQEEFRWGRPVYDFLINCLRERNLTRHQRANALVVLCKLRSVGNADELQSVLVEHARHNEPRVRSQAATLLRGLIILNGYREPYCSQQSIDAMRAGLALGLHQPAKERAIEVLAEIESRTTRLR